MTGNYVSMGNTGNDKNIKKNNWQIFMDIFRVGLPASIAMSSTIFIEIINLAFVG